jgi:hypothetical protein
MAYATASAFPGIAFLPGDRRLAFFPAARAGKNLDFRR